MIIAEELWRKYKNMKQELLDLKQFKKANVASKYYIFTQSGGTYYNAWRITYKNGTQPIIAEALSYSDTALSSPAGNTQYLFSYSQAITSLTILSTREVESIVGINMI